MISYRRTLNLQQAILREDLSLECAYPDSRAWRACTSRI